MWCDTSICAFAKHVEGFCDFLFCTGKLLAYKKLLNFCVLVGAFVWTIIAIFFFCFWDMLRNNDTKYDTI